MVSRPHSNHKLTTGFALVFVLLLVNALLSFQNVRRIIDNNQQVARTHTVLAQLQSVLSTMQDAETGQRGYIITGQEPYLEPYNSAEARIGGQMQELKALITAPTVKPLVPALNEQVQGRFVAMRQTIAIRRKQGLEAAQKRILTGVGKQRMDAIRRIIASMARGENKLLLEREEQSRAAGRNALMTLGVSSLAGLALLALVYFIIGRDAGRRQRDADQLKASSDRFGAIVNSTSQIIWTRDTKGGFTEEQPSWSAFTGQSFEELKGNGWQQAIHADDRERVASQWNAAVQNPGLFELEYRLRRHDGEYRTMAVRAAPVRDDNGTVREWVGASTDITERKQAEAELHESQAQFQILANSVPQLVWMADATGNISWYNQRWYDYTGTTLEEMKGWGWDEVHHPEHIKPVVESWSKALKEQTPWEDTFPIRSKSGEYGWFLSRAVPVRDDMGRVVRWFGTNTDVTKERQAEEELATHARLATLSAEVGLALTRTDSLRDILQSCTEAVVNHLDAAFARVWTLNETENVLELQASAGLYTHLDGPHSRVPVGKFKIGQIASERQPHLTNQVVGDSRVGDQEWAQREGMVSFAGYPLIVEGRLLGVMAMFARHALPESVLRALATVTDAVSLGVKRKRAEEELERARHAAEEASRTKSLFLANMSHELRTPLNAILGYSEMLQEEAQDQELDGFTSDLDKINGAGKHLLSLINDILDLSKIEAGKMELYLEEFDVAGMLQEVAATATPLVQKNTNTLQLEFAPELGVMRGDLTKMRQCLFNLLSNAAKFTKEGRITLTVRRERMEDMNGGATRDWMTFGVTDSGIGMSAEQILGLFQAFTQADASTTRKFGGTGLGLALTRRFSQMMGGDVTVQSVPGEGSTFTIKIPAIAEAEEDADIVTETQMGTASDAMESQTLPAPGTCVLVIDDDATQRDLMRRFLNKEGFQAQTASSGEEGLRLAHQLQPIAITLDVMMPGMDGWSVLLALKASATLRDIPVIMLTMVDDKNRGYALGAADYATKPVDRARLSQILNKYVCAHPPCPVLLVEDDKATREIMRSMLEKEGWTVSEATNGREALERVAENRPNLILLDLMMPEMDGFEFAAALRHRPEWSSIPIVVLTAKDLTNEDRLKLNGYVQKVLQKAGHSREEMLQQVSELVSGCAVPGTASRDK